MTTSTVYIVGAGASYEVGLPVGSALKNEIADILRMDFEYGSIKDGNYELYQALKLHSKDNSEADEYFQACRHIRNSMPLAISIDNFIHSDRKNDKLTLCAKIGIVDTILKSEKRSKLFFDKYRGKQTINFSALENTWYLPLFRTLTENCRADDLLERFSYITLVVFNYDRCIEHFLFHAIITYYRLPEEKATEIISNLTIIHPYGTVGTLPWQIKTDSAFIEYGGDVQTSHLIKYANGIRTFTEGAHSDSMETLKQKMETCKRLVFLGFAFHRLNMELISQIDTERYNNQSLIDCYATAFETSKSDQESISSSITHLYQGSLNINIENMTCTQLFKDYSRSLGYL